MDRRRFLSASAGLGALALSGAARADADTWRRFHAALERDPSLAVYADLTGEQAAEAHVDGRLPADLHGHFFRNGPGRFELGGERHHHWFDGDGFAQRWTIADARDSSKRAASSTNRAPASSWCPPSAPWCAGAGCATTTT
jgi:all-trans-8'-apo-beta-carotenal 15,15'-oxygenase